MKRKVSVSIVSANYNNESYLDDFIQSIMDSTVIPKELIIIEDGSEDKSASKIEEYQHLDFLMVIQHKHNLGLAASLNEGLGLATGKYIMRTDPDDFISSDRIEKQFSYLEDNPDIDILGSNVVYYNEHLSREVFRSKFPARHEAIYKQYFSGYHGLVHASIMGKSTVLKDYEFTEDAYPAEEYDIFSRMALNNVKMANIREPLTYYRIYERNMDFEKLKNSVIKTIAIRDNLFGVSSGRIRIWWRIYHWYYYRKSLGASSRINMIFYLSLSIMLQPGKIIKRLGYLW